MTPPYEKIDGKQTTFFTEDSAEYFEFSNHCHAQQPANTSQLGDFEHVCDFLLNFINQHG
jgi:hypothetical protein